jgi:hypothetical protein
VGRQSVAPESPLARVNCEREKIVPFYERGQVRIHYEEAGSGFPLLVIPGGGLLEPIATNGTDAGRALNRRVAVKSLTAEAETRM